MGINGIGANYYQAGYTNSKAAKTGKSFAEIASQKVAEADKQYCLDRASAVEHIYVRRKYCSDKARRKI